MNQADQNVPHTRLVGRQAKERGTVETSSERKGRTTDARGFKYSTAQKKAINSMFIAECECTGTDIATEENRQETVASVLNALEPPKKQQKSR